MRTHAFSVALLLVMSTSSCEKTDSPSQPASASKTVASPVAAKPAAAVAAAPHKTAAVAKSTEGQQHNCAGEKKTGAACGGPGSSCNQWDEAAAKVIKRTPPKDAKWTTFSVSGMHCGGCERRIIANLGQLEGVVSVEADAESGKVRVASAPDGKVGRAQLVSTIEGLGYKVSP